MASLELDGFDDDDDDDDEEDDKNSVDLFDLVPSAGKLTQNTYYQSQLVLN